MNKLYAESDSLLIIKIKDLERLKDNEQRKDLTLVKNKRAVIKREKNKTLEDLKLRLKGYKDVRKGSKEYYFVFFYSEKQKRDLTILFDDKFEIILKEDKLVN